MLGTSFGEWLLIRLSIPLFRYTPLFYFIPLVALFFTYGRDAINIIPTQVLLGVLMLEGLFFVFIYLPYTSRLNQDARHPKPLSTEARKALFNRCLISVPSPELYLQWWFLGADPDEIRRENVREFVLWAFFERDHDILTWKDTEVEPILEELDEYIAIFEQRLGRRFKDGRGTAKSLRLTLDSIYTTYRSLAWYVTIFFLDQATHLAFFWHGFQYYRRSGTAALRIFPPRPQMLVASKLSPAPTLSYWYRPHAARDRLPVVFFHGIGIGLWTYVRFLADVAARKRPGQTGIGVIAIEIMPISFRLTPPIADKAEFLEQMTTILDYHCWDNFTVVSHSYGSVLTTHMLHSPRLQYRIPSVVLIDPVTIMLHLPNVAYNFTRRRPRRANEWQLWYFASTDPGVAYCLGRHFFWRENIIWKDELLTIETGAHGGGRKAAVCLSGRDLIVDTGAVAQYLEDDPEQGAQQSGQQSDVEVIMFPKLDHAQVFDEPSDCRRVVDLIRNKCQH